MVARFTLTHRAIETRVTILVELARADARETAVLSFTLW